MTWLELRRISGLLVGDRGEPTPGEGASVSDILLQVVLPIVLILAFFAFTSARVFDDRRKEVDELLNEVKELRSSMEGVADLRQRLAELEENEKELDRWSQELNQQAHLLSQRSEELGQQAEAIREQAGELDNRAAQLGWEAEKIREEAHQLEEWWQKVVETEPAAQGQELSEAFIEIQRQRLVAGLEQISAEHRIELGLPGLAARTVRVGESGQLIDDQRIFSHFCEEVGQIFSADGIDDAEIDRLYRRVLAVAGIVDPDGAPIEPVTRDSRVVMDGRNARAGVMTDDNRVFLRQSIRMYLANLRLDAVEAQQKVVYGVFAFYNGASSKALYGWIPDLEDLVRSLIEVERAGGNTQPFEEAIRDRVYGQIRTDFGEQGCVLLSDVTEHK